jgi:hypothetical protein
VFFCAGFVLIECELLAQAVLIYPAAAKLLCCGDDTTASVSVTELLVTAKLLVTIA